MRIAYDHEVDALTISFRDVPATSKRLAEGIAADYDEQGRLVGLEILDAIRRFGDATTLRQVVIEGLGPGNGAQRKTA